LQNVADAAYPVANKHLSRLLPLMGAYPEEAALAVATLPLVLGYFAAQSAHEAKQDKRSTQQHGIDSTDC
jgi:hypothetical protein